MNKGIITKNNVTFNISHSKKQGISGNIQRKEQDKIHKITQIFTSQMCAFLLILAEEDMVRTHKLQLPTQSLTPALTKWLAFVMVSLSSFVHLWPGWNVS